ncbi:MAG: regulatory protein RecX [Rhodospirillales bacterium]|nr:regulatory protein RecX [Rhodospirillales bacterium]
MNDQTNNSKHPAAQKRVPKAPKKITESYLYNAGLHYLERFPASSAHFTAVMNRKIQKSCRWHTDQDPDQCREMLGNLVLKFTDLGLLNDESYARGMVTSLRRRGMAARAIEMRLQAKGLPRDLIRHMLAQIDGETSNNSEIEAAIRMTRRKRIGPYRPADRPHDKNKSRDKELAALARSGFSYDIAKTVIDMSQEDAEAYQADRL